MLVKVTTIEMNFQIPQIPKKGPTQECLHQIQEALVVVKHLVAITGTLLLTMILIIKRMILTEVMVPVGTLKEVMIWGQIRLQTEVQQEVLIRA